MNKCGLATFDATNSTFIGNNFTFNTYDIILGNSSGSKVANNNFFFSILGGIVLIGSGSTMENNTFNFSGITIPVYSKLRTGLIRNDTVGGRPVYCYVNQGGLRSRMMQDKLY